MHEHSHLRLHSNYLTRGRFSVLVSMSPGAVLLSSLATLSPRQRESYYNLSYVNFPAGIPPGTDAYNEELALAIFQTNAVSAGSQGVGIFPRMARLNHGCSRAFNVVYTWRDDEGVLVVHALKPIKQGEVSSMCYVEIKMARYLTIRLQGTPNYIYRYQASKTRSQVCSHWRLEGKWRIDIHHGQTIPPGALWLRMPVLCLFPPR